MIRSLCLFSIFYFFTLIPVCAQNQQGGGSGRTMPGFGRRALVLDIDVRVLDEEQNILWNENQNKTAIPGTPVEIQLVGSNLVVAAQLTPFIRRNGNMLVAHVRIWINDPQSGVVYYTSLQTVPIELDEQIHFFPLGSSQKSDTSIEMIITVSSLFENNSNIEEAADSTDNDN